jgi:hypothetical protein
MSQDPIDGSKHFARFTLPNGEAVDGEFLLDGPQTHVILYMDRPHSAQSGDFTTVHAYLPARGCLSFLNCIVLGEETSYSSRERLTHRVRFYPHFAALGGRA